MYFQSLSGLLLCIIVIHQLSPFIKIVTSEDGREIPQKIHRLRAFAIIGTMLVSLVSSFYFCLDIFQGR